MAWMYSDKLAHKVSAYSSPKSHIIQIRVISQGIIPARCILAQVGKQTEIWRCLIRMWATWFFAYNFLCATHTWNNSILISRLISYSISSYWNIIVAPVRCLKLLDQILVVGLVLLLYFFLFCEWVKYSGSYLVILRMFCRNFDIKIPQSRKKGFIR